MMKVKQLFKMAVESNLPDKDIMLNRVMAVPFKAEKSRHSYVFRAAAATLVLLLVVLAGVPLLTSTPQLHDFELTVNATTIEKDVAVDLTQGRILEYKETPSGRAMIININVFNIVGDGITSIKFACETGQLDWHDKELEQQLESDPNYFSGYPCIARAVIPAYYVPNPDNGQPDYGKFWRDMKKGLFPDFAAKLPDDRPWYQYGWMASGLRDDNTYEIAITDTESGNDCAYFFNGKEIDVKYCDGQQNVLWMNESDTWPTKLDDGTYAGIPDDIVTITATFDDGLTATKKIKISLTPDGKFLAEEI